MIPNIRIGKPISHGSLTVFPLFCEDHRPIDYLLSDEAMEAGIGHGRRSHRAGQRA